jgi:hypothetical protein
MCTRILDMARKNLDWQPMYGVWLSKGDALLSPHVGVNGSGVKAHRTAETAS